MTLRNQIIRLAHANPVLRPHLLQVLAGSGLTQFLVPALEDAIFLSGAKTKYKAVKTDKSEYDATTSVDRWSYRRDEHYTEDSGGYLPYRWPSKVLCLIETDVRNMPPNSSVQNVEGIIRAYLAREGAEQFQNEIEADGDLWEFLNEALDPDGGSIKNASWKVTRATVQDVKVRFDKSTADISARVLLDVDVNLDDAEVALDEPDWERDYDPEDRRYGSLRKEVIRLAHEHPEFRKELLPLVVK